MIEISYHSFERFPEIQIGIANGGRLPLYVNQVNIYTSVQGGVYSHSINVDQRYEPAVQIPPLTDKMISIINLIERRVIANGSGLELIKDLTKEERTALYTNSNIGNSAAGHLLTGKARCGFDISTFQDNDWPEPTISILSRQISCETVGPELLRLLEIQDNSF